VDRKNPYYILSFLEKIAIKRTVLTLFLFTVCSSLNAQNFKKIKPYSWMLGVQWRTTVKIGVTPEFYTTDADYLHHQFGLIYKFPEIGKNNAGASKAQHSWTKKKYRYRKPRGM
jgi:hypothetical protein